MVLEPERGTEIGMTIEMYATTAQEMGVPEEEPELEPELELEPV
jgi:hypothetical protein